jgi:hypothetical protein
VQDLKVIRRGHLMTISNGTFSICIKSSFDIISFIELGPFGIVE